MLEKLHLKNVGPAPELEMEFAPRLNIITGDNGLGKSFILDVAWWVLTQNWITEVNPQIQNSKRKNSVTASISSKVLNSDQKPFSTLSNFVPTQQQWSSPKIEIENTAMVLHFHTDGLCAVKDPERNQGWFETPVFVFSAKDVWDGFEPDGKVISNGLIRDVAKWQLEKGAALEQFKAALKVLSPSQQETLELGALTSISISDARDIPTLKMPYNQEIPFIHASSAIRRILSFAYMIVWTWQEHLRIVNLRGISVTREIVLLIDELEQHLHPQWQRSIVGSILEVVKAITKDGIRIQIIATTHSPLVMASLEPLFDPKKDAWFDFNLVKGEVKLEKMQWRKRGGAAAWLRSEAFDLPSDENIQANAILEKASKAFTNPKLSKRKFLELDSELRETLGETHPFWVRWGFLGQQKGWL
jgi:AAA domain, putative AbiEii toxin, Type IV TA system